MLLFLTSAVRGEGISDKVDAYLAAGEYGPASAMTAQVEDAALRDALLARIATSQADAGAHRASLSTAAHISGDESRAAALKHLVAHSNETPRNETPQGDSRGGGTEADFETLIELITSTIEPRSWDINGGDGAIDGFEGGIFVNTDGLMKRILNERSTRHLNALRNSAAAANQNHNVNQSSEMRMVSLTRLEKAVQLAWAAGDRPDEAMQMMAGLRRIDYVFIYPERGDVVIAGPAGGWIYDTEGRAVDPDTGRPVVRLDDFVVVLRAILGEEARFGCSITPRQENLAQTQAFLNESSQRPLRAGEKGRWLEDLRSTLGRQDIDIYGIDPNSRTARVLVEADYRMKLVGMGLEEGTVGVTSYLDSAAEAGGNPSLDVLRWWFTLNYDAVVTTDLHNAYRFQGQGVRVLSENELLTELGERQHTGESEPINQAFARSFTQHFEDLATRYPIYAELENIFDLAMVAGLIRSENLADRADWHLTHFSANGDYQVERGNTPTEVETVIAHRNIDQGRFIAQVSGGVTVDPNDLIAPEAIEVSEDDSLFAARKLSTLPEDLPADSWWWDCQ